MFLTYSHFKFIYCISMTVPPGLQISPTQMSLTFNDTVSIMCSTDLDVTTIEWIADGITEASSNNQSLTLLLDPVSADHHNSQYTCRVISPYGTQEEMINITVQCRQSNHSSILLYTSNSKPSTLVQWLITNSYIL